MSETQKRFEYAVFGYVRFLESSLDLQVVPEPIAWIIFSYYYLTDYFSRFRDDWFRISHDKMRISNLRSASWSWHSVFLNEWIQSTSNTINEWTFSFEKASSLVVGIVSSLEDVKQDFSLKGNHPNYAVMSRYGDIYINGGTAKDWRPQKWKSYSLCDDVTFILNLSTATFSMKIPKESINITLINNITISQDVKYQFALQSCDHDSVVILKNFISYLPL